jgi:hypothetical protein
MAHELMQSEIKTLCWLQKIVFSWHSECHGWWSLDVKRPEIHKPFLETLEIGLVCFECFSTKKNYRKLLQSFLSEYTIPIKRLKTLNTDFINIHQYIKKFRNCKICNFFYFNFVVITNNWSLFFYCFEEPVSFLFFFEFNESALLSGFNRL